MKRSSKAALLSALILPGIGHLFLKHSVRGSALILSVFIALAVILSGVYQRAQAIVESIKSGEVPTDIASITELVSSSTHSSDGSTESTALIVIVVCWVFGIIDSYRLGLTQDKQTRV